ncbi:hypothetical protein C8Q75DRAFT_894496 [Abortiporus biennis]|nr:hypothetical protein C8Q75DRAFT_894496 [Abortiporus biennis]
MNDIQFSERDDTVPKSISSSKHVGVDKFLPYHDNALKSKSFDDIPMVTVEESIVGNILDGLNENTQENLPHDELSRPPSNTSSSRKKRKNKQKNVDPWTKVSEALTKYDRRKISDYKEDIDTLLVFAGLFSAVLTAFVIEVYKGLNEDPATVSSQVLFQISRQLSSFQINGAFTNSTIPAATPVPFTRSRTTTVINTLWFLSLSFSLITASLAMLVKQWLREYMAFGSLSAHAHVQIRFYRNTGLIKYRVFEIAAFLPLLLQASLALFFTGLGIFLYDLDHTLARIIVPFLILWAVLFFLASFWPAFSSKCPYKTPFLKDILQGARYIIYAIPTIIKTIHFWPYFEERAGTVSLSQGFISLIQLEREGKTRVELVVDFLRWKNVQKHCAALSSPNFFAKLKVFLDYSFVTERSLIGFTPFDKEAILAADATFVDDTFLLSALECLPEFHSVEEALSTSRSFIRNRLNHLPVDFEMNAETLQEQFTLNGRLTNQPFFHKIQHLVARSLVTASHSGRPLFPDTIYDAMFLVTIDGDEETRRDREEDRSEMDRLIGYAASNFMKLDVSSTLPVLYLMVQELHMVSYLDQLRLENGEALQNTLALVPDLLSSDDCNILALSYVFTRLLQTTNPYTLDQYGMTVRSVQGLLADAIEAKKDEWVSWKFHVGCPEDSPYLPYQEILRLDKYSPGIVNPKLKSMLNEFRQFSRKIKHTLEEMEHGRWDGGMRAYSASLKQSNFGPHVNDSLSILSVKSSEYPLRDMLNGRMSVSKVSLRDSNPK